MKPEVFTIYYEVAFHRMGIFYVSNGGAWEANREELRITDCIQRTFQVGGHEINATFSKRPMPETFSRIREILLNSAFAIADLEGCSYNGDVHLDNFTSHTKVPLSENERSTK